MARSVAAAVAEALPTNRHLPRAPTEVDLRELQTELDEVAREALDARNRGIPLPDAFDQPAFPKLSSFHQDLRDALFVEIPGELEAWVQQWTTRGAPTNRLPDTLFQLARHGSDQHNADLQQALAELLLFEAVRLRLLVTTWESTEFESVGGEEEDIDRLAWEEVQALMAIPEIEESGVRPLQVMFAAASLALARDAAHRAADLLRTGEDAREELRMRAKLKEALRELRLPEAVLLENALSALLGSKRLELPDLQERRPVALEGLSRQAMDQRVSRGRRALVQSGAHWPRRRRPALFDLLRSPPDA